MAISAPPFMLLKSLCILIQPLQFYLRGNSEGVVQGPMGNQRGSNAKPGFLTPKPGTLLFCLFGKLVCLKRLESRLTRSSLLGRTGLSLQTSKAGKEDPTPLSSISSC